MTTYGYIGLGQMGSAMAGHLLATGAPVVVHDVDDAALQAITERGGQPASSAREVAERCDVVSVCVPAAEHLKAVLDGPGGLAEAGREDLTVLVHSTVAPETVRDLHESAATWGGRLHDACVAGGVASAVNGDLMILAGGVGDMAPAAVELLNVYGSKVIDGGPVGAGAALKLGFNLMTYAQFTAAATAFDLARRSGVDPQGIVEAWRHIGQLGRLTESFLFVLALEPEQVAGDLRALLVSSADIAAKDLTLASSLLDESSALRAIMEQLAPTMAHVYRVAEEEPR